MDTECGAWVALVNQRSIMGHMSNAVTYRITHLETLALCQRADICSALSGATRRVARLALAETLRNLRILTH